MDKLSALRELRAELQDLQALLGRVREGQTTMAEHAPYLVQNRREIAALFRRIIARGGGAAGATTAADDVPLPADQLRHLINLWQQVLCASILARPDSAISADEQVKQIAACDALLSSMVVCIGNLTIPAKLNEILSTAWAGYLLSFHDLFSADLPVLEDRQRLLRFLAASPDRILNGIVEPESGLIYPYHRDAWRRWLVCLGLLATMVGITWGVSLLSRVQFVVDTVKLGRDVLIMDWLLVVAGVLTHLAIDRSKGSVLGVASIPLSHVSSAIDARAGTILIKMTMMIVGYLGLIFLGGQENANHMNAYLVGYSLDSFVGVFSTAMERKAAAKGAALTQALGS